MIFSENFSTSAFVYVDQFESVTHTKATCYVTRGFLGTFSVTLNHGVYQVLAQPLQELNSLIEKRKRSEIGNFASNRKEGILIVQTAFRLVSHFSAKITSSRRSSVGAQCKKQRSEKRERDA